MKDFRDSQVWRKAHQLTLQVYRATGGFPPHEQYGLVGQVRRACLSIPANLAEGCCRQGDREFARFVQIAMSSASEVEYLSQNPCGTGFQPVSFTGYKPVPQFWDSFEYLLLSAGDLEYLTGQPRESLIGAVVEVKRMLAGLLATLKTDL